MGNSNEKIKQLILDMLKEHGRMKIGDLLIIVNNQLNNGGITEQELKELINSMPEKIKRLPQINNSPEEVELASSVPAPLPPSTNPTVSTLPQKRIGIPPIKKKS